MRARVLLASLVLTLSATSASASPGAHVARRCGTVTLDNGTDAKALVRRGHVSCHTALRIAETYFTRILNHDHPDGRFPDGSIYYRAAHGFRCATGLGGSEGFCTRGRRKVDVSTRPDDF